MTARRLALAWASGATLGLAVGFLLGESVRDGLDLARLARPEPRTGAGTGTSATEALNAALRGAERFPHQRSPLDEAAATDLAAAIRPGEPGVRYIDPALLDQPSTLDEHGHCTAVSPGGGLRCIVSGPHAGHWWEAVYAPDAKDDADERIE